MEVKIKQQVRKANIYGSCLSLDSFFLRSVLFPNLRELGVQVKQMNIRGLTDSRGEIRWRLLISSQLGGRGTARSFS
ncbi:hypothetical protein NC651_009892 [Populus alba x Populus x berolinensis]|nr:hypothetical protein NC651_009892 [Populus alba x Populus x berolinensis]